MQTFDDTIVVPGQGCRGALSSSENTLCIVQFQGFVVCKDMARNFERERLGHRERHLHCRNYKDMVPVFLNPNVPVLLVRIQVKSPLKPQKQHTHTHTHTLTQTHTHTHTHTHTYTRTHRSGLRERGSQII